MLMCDPKSLLLVTLLAGVIGAPLSAPSSASWEELQSEHSNLTETIDGHLSELQRVQDEVAMAELGLATTSTDAELSESLHGYAKGTKSVHEEYASETRKAKAAVEAFKKVLQEDQELPEEVQAIAEQANVLESAYDAHASAWATWWSGPGKRYKAVKDLETAEKDAKQCQERMEAMEDRLARAEQRLSDAEHNVKVVTDLLEPYNFVTDEDNFRELSDALERANAKLSEDQHRAASAAVDFFRPIEDPNLGDIMDEIASETPGSRYANEILGDVEKLRKLTEDNIIEYLTRYQDDVEVLEGDESQPGSVAQLESALEAARAASAAASHKLALLKTKAIPEGPDGATDEVLKEGRAAVEAARVTLKTRLNSPEIRETISARPALSAARDQCLKHVDMQKVLADAIQTPEALNDLKFQESSETSQRKLSEDKATLDKAKRTIEEIKGHLETVQAQEQAISKEMATRQANVAALAALAEF